MIETERLVLRCWKEKDIPEFVRVTNTPAVMEYLGGVQKPESFVGAFQRMQASQAENGFCFWIMERKYDKGLLGFCGLKVGNIATILCETEIGWRLREEAWGQGYAREAAQASLDWAWKSLSCPRIVAIAAAGNTRSWGLMKRLGMHRAPDLDFEHPDFPLGHPVRAHIGYAIAHPANDRQGPE